MKTITVTANEAGQRLDRFLKKYLRAAPLSLVYRLIRKDVRVNGSRAGIDLLLQEGDEIALYLDDARLGDLERQSAGGGRGAGGAGPGGRRVARPKIRFKVCYEDDNVLVVSKPYGLLTHGDGREKKETLVNQVIGYLLDKGDYDPAAERVFTPSPVNRLDRNTSGLVAFGKNAKAVRDFSRMIAADDAVRKYYVTLALGEIAADLTLEGGILKDSDANRVTVVDSGSGAGMTKMVGAGMTDEPAAVKSALTLVRPVEVFRGGPCGVCTLCEVRLVTGRPHQIRAHLAAAGHPVAGDPKYGDRAANRRFEKDYALTSQFLHACRLEVVRGHESLSYLEGTVIESPLPPRLRVITDALR